MTNKQFIEGWKKIYNEWEIRLTNRRIYMSHNGWMATIRYDVDETNNISDIQIIYFNGADTRNFLNSINFLLKLEKM